MFNTNKAFRRRRLSLAGDGKSLLVPLDHSVSDGPVVPAGQWDDLLRSLVAGGADGIIVHKGRARTVAPDILASCALVVHLSASTACGPDVNAKVLVGDVEEAVRLGADAVSVHVNIGSDTEGQQLADLGAVARSCDAWGMPLIAMVYPRGPRIKSSHDPALLAHVANIAADLGADFVKTSVALPLERMADVVASSPIPILVAGGPPDGSDLIEYGTAVMASGCGGLAIGRRIFSAPSPASLLSQLSAVVHGSHDTSGELVPRPRPHPHKATNGMTQYPTIVTGAA